MLKLLKLKHLITIVLLVCSIGSLANNANILPTGGLDSIYVSYDDLRKANAKMIELEYEKAKNEKLNTIINNDSIIIAETRKINNSIKQDNRRLLRQRNILGGTSIGLFILTIISFLK